MSDIEPDIEIVEDPVERTVEGTVEGMVEPPTIHVADAPASDDEDVEFVNVPPRHGDYILRFPAGDYIAAEITKREAPYEYPLLAFIAATLTRRSVVVDVGANVGNHAVYLAHTRGATVHAFEPSAESLGHLRYNVIANDLEDRIVVHDVALGARRCWATLADRPAGNLGGTRVEIDGGDGSIGVIRLDDIQFGRVDVIKIDVEGDELDVIDGASATIRTHRPLVVAEAQDFTALSATEKALAAYGYRRYWRDLSPLCTPTYLYAPSRAALASAIISNIPRALANRIRRRRM